MLRRTRKEWMSDGNQSECFITGRHKAAAGHSSSHMQFFVALPLHPPLRTCRRIDPGTIAQKASLFCLAIARELSKVQHPSRQR